MVPEAPVVLYRRQGGWLCSPAMDGTPPHRLGATAWRGLLCLALALPLTPGAALAAGTDVLEDWLRERGLLAPAVADRSAEVVVAAMAYLGVGYRLGGNGFEQGFDCSGFTRHVVAGTLGLLLPRRAEEQARSDIVRPVPREALQPGDLVFFNTLRRSFSHVGIYIGEGRFIHAPRSGAQVRVERMGLPYWSSRFEGARRLHAAAPAGGQAHDESATPP
jgi:cell wall-associated NlpC family hydrolase